MVKKEKDNNIKDVEFIEIEPKKVVQHQQVDQVDQMQQQEKNQGPKKKDQQQQDQKSSSSSRKKTSIKDRATKKNRIVDKVKKSLDDMLPDELEELKKKHRKELTNQQKIFISEYMLDYNADRAARVAGYNGEGNDVLANNSIKREIDKRVDERIQVLTITAELVLNGILEIAQDQYAKNCDRLRAYELLGKHLKLFTDKIDIKAEATNSIDINVSMDDKLKEWSK